VLENVMLMAIFSVGDTAFALGVHL